MEQQHEETKRLYREYKMSQISGGIMLCADNPITFIEWLNALPSVPSEVKSAEEIIMKKFSLKYMDTWLTDKSREMLFESMEEYASQFKIALPSDEEIARRSEPNKGEKLTKEKLQEVFDKYSLVEKHSPEYLPETSYGQVIKEICFLTVTTTKEGNEGREWISAETPPEIGADPDYPFSSEMILLSDGEFTYYGQYENSEDGQYWIDSNGDEYADNGVTITHWQPLPEAPNNNFKSNNKH